jgi:hypothetical protein
LNIIPGSFEVRIKKCRIKIGKEGEVIFRKKTVYASWFEFVEKIYTTHEKFLEKSKSLELNLRKFWS